MAYEDTCRDLEVIARAMIQKLAGDCDMSEGAVQQVIQDVHTAMIDAGRDAVENMGFVPKTDDPECFTGVGAGFMALAFFMHVLTQLESPQGQRTYRELLSPEMQDLRNLIGLLSSMRDDMGEGPGIDFDDDDLDTVDDGSIDDPWRGLDLD